MPHSIEWGYLLGDRLPWFSFGIMVGWLLSKIKDTHTEVRKFRDVVERHVKAAHYHRNEDGFMRNRGSGMLMLVVVCVTAFAAFQSQVALNHYNDQAELLANNVVVADAKQQCTTNTMFSALSALNGRTKFSKEQSEANIELQKSQLPLVRAIFTPVSDLNGLRIAQRYLNALEEFLRVANKSSHANNNNPIPTLNEYLVCLREARKATAD